MTIIKFISIFSTKINSGIKLRAVKGLKGCKYLDPGALTDALSYVMGPLAEMLEDLGYEEGLNIDASPVC